MLLTSYSVAAILLVLASGLMVALFLPAVRRVVLSLLAIAILHGIVLDDCWRNFLMTRLQTVDIPALSSLCYFRQTALTHQVNSPYKRWAYGEDGQRFYTSTCQQHCTGVADYHFITRAEAALCPGFDAQDVNTWCQLHPGLPAEEQAIWYYASGFGSK